MKVERRNITQPLDWWAAFSQQAAQDGQTLSQWLGACGVANLTESVADALSERPPANRPRKPRKGE